MSQRLLEEVADSSLMSSGCIKFDLKAWDDTLHTVLTGITNRQILENFERLAKRISSRPEFWGRALGIQFLSYLKDRK